MNDVFRIRVRSASGGKGAIHALWSLEGIGALDKDTHQAALLSKDAALRRNAIRALPANDNGRQLFFSSPVIQDPDLLTRQVAFATLLEFPTIPEIQTVVAQLPRIPVNSSDSFLNDTLTLLGRIHKVANVGENVVTVMAGDAALAGMGDDLFQWICHPHEGALGIAEPIQMYPLMDTALGALRVLIVKAGTGGALRSGGFAHAPAPPAFVAPASNPMCSTIDHGGRTHSPPRAKW